MTDDPHDRARPRYTFTEEVIRDLDGRELWRGIGPLCRADLRGLDLRGADLRGAWLRRVRLAGADLRGADLSFGHFFMADLTAADLRGACLDAADFGAASLRDADLRGAKGYIWPSPDDESAAAFPVDLCGADLRGWVEPFLLPTEIVVDAETRLDEEQLVRRGLLLRKRIVQPIQVADWLERRRLDGTDTCDASVVRDSLGRVAWSWFREHADVNGSVEHEDLSGCRLGEWATVLLDVAPGPAILDGCDLQGAELWLSLWSDVRARGADLRGAILCGSSWYRCDLRESCFDGAELGYSGIGTTTTWNECDLDGARFVGADLCGADLSTCSVEGADFRGACIDPATSFPPETDLSSFGLVERPLPSWKRG